MKTVEQVELFFEQKVGEALRELDLLPEGFRHRVRFHGKTKDKKKTAAFEKNWSPETDSIHIRFEPVQEAAKPSESVTKFPEAIARFPTAPATSSPTKTSGGIAADPLSDLIQALDRAESRRGYDFVSLKWFRDAALPAEGLSWTSSDATRQTVLRGAIERRLILTSKVPNPKSPQFPVTAIRLNRLMPEVKAVLGSGDNNALDFHPVEIRGEKLSATILRERR
jgi:hypothetical protein